jgi:iron(III)-salmochelin esterase
VIGRREFVFGMLAGCGRSCEPKAESRQPPPPLVYLPPDATPGPDGETPRGLVDVDTWTLPGDGRAVAIVPRGTTTKLPMLIALHGRGEALKGPDHGVQGWPSDYLLLRALHRVANPPLAVEDFEGFVTPSRLASHNAELAKRPFGGLVVVCPYAPDVDLRKPARIREYAAYVMNEIVPRATRELPVLPEPASLGIDGVSLGGALALRIGLTNPRAFGAVGTLQAAIGEDQITEFTELAKRARQENPALQLRLLTSTEDYFRRAITHTSEAWRAAGIGHEILEVPGPHDYPFNRGPGAIEMLLWHDRVLTRQV